MLQAFRKWQAAVRHQKFTARQHLLSSHLLLLSPLYSSALLQARRLMLELEETGTGELVSFILT
jgi:hypothetical protein